MANLNEEEARLVAETQADLAAIKANLRECVTRMRRMGRINREAGRAKAANACMRFEGALSIALGSIMTAHADASDALNDSYDDGGVVIMGGGGGR